VVANYLVVLAGPPPHEGGLAGETIKRYSADLLAARSLCGRQDTLDPLWKYFQLVRDGLVARPDKRPPRHNQSDQVWDTSLLTTWWQSQGPNAAMTTSLLRAKALSLVMLACQARPSDLERLDCDTLKEEEHRLVVYVWRAKNGGSGYQHEPFAVPLLSEGDSSICPGRALRDYVARMAPHSVQTTDSSSVRPVFLSLARPFKGLTADRISAIIRGVLENAGAPKSTYSIRKQATTLALDRGLPEHLVQANGRWARRETMHAHYVRPTDASVVGRSILQRRTGEDG